MRNFTEYFIESILDPEQPTLNQKIFDLSNLDRPKLHKEVRAQIVAGLSKISKSVNVLDYTLIGSILTRRYAEDSDVDVNILINADQAGYDKARQIAIENSGRTVSGTKHPINYHVLSDKADFDNANESADGVFDIGANTFIRKPIDKPFHVEKYFDAFQDVVSKIDALKGELKDDLVDYSVLKTFTKDDVESLRKKIQDKLDEIESDAQGLSTLHDKIVQDRNAGFAKKLTPNEIREYGTKNRLPGNVIYKLLERHHYLEFLHQVEDAIQDGHISDKEANKLLDIVS
jgi:predicted nucleotidyltransferase